MPSIPFLNTSDASITIRAAGESTEITGLCISVDTAGELATLSVGSTAVWYGYLDPTATPFCATFPEIIPVPEGQAITITKETASVDYAGSVFING